MADEMIFIPRYLAKQQPPSDIRTILQAVRFVALVPFLEDWQAFHDTNDVWSTSEEFLELRAGDWEEHAILLHNYFLWIDDHLKHGNRYRNYLVLGTAVPEGETVYVLREDTQPSPHEYVFWNASTGQGYASTDPDSPLKDVGMLVTMQGSEYPQMWANVSEMSSPLMLDFDVDNDAKVWRPFFSKGGGFRPEQVREFSSVQELSLRYRPTPALFVRQLEDMLRDMIKQQVRQWRQSIKAMRTMRTHFLQHAKSRKYHS
jgi:coiled-coil and C2 domain-containing protein 2A